ncbi:MAG: RNA polymerase II C-terminal domain kinase beta subunit [Trizodia sp. TS-e1964]|nr:MAG: RNA polymerase II C-terminal domain kinase beta subunit [Trizodia sp. TS-e1964]
MAHYYPDPTPEGVCESPQSETEENFGDPIAAFESEFPSISPLDTLAYRLAMMENGTPGPHPSFIQVARPFIFEAHIREMLEAIGSDEAKEDTMRLQGISWIDQVRRALQLPVRTFDTAAVYFHKFRLVHVETEYNFQDAAAAALFTACKIEDTLKKSKEILCAAYNLKVSQSEQLSPDDNVFEGPSKTILGLERLMLESSGFDFRSRYPQGLLCKIMKFYCLDNDVGQIGYSIMLDLYRTFAPLKQSSATMALACLELATRVLKKQIDKLHGENGADLNLWSTSRHEIMESLLDLLDLYTHHRNQTALGQEHPLDTFIAIRITLNQEAFTKGLRRFTECCKKRVSTNESSKSLSEIGGKKETPIESKLLPSTLLAGERGREGTVRYMLDAERARVEQATVDTFFRIEEEEYVVNAGPEASHKR